MANSLEFYLKPVKQRNMNRMIQKSLKELATDTRAIYRDFIEGHKTVGNRAEMNQINDFIAVNLLMLQRHQKFPVVELDYRVEGMRKNLKKTDKGDLMYKMLSEHKLHQKYTQNSIGNIMLELKASQRNEATIGNFISKRLW